MCFRCKVCWQVKVLAKSQKGTPGDALQPFVGNHESRAGEGVLSAHVRQEWRSPSRGWNDRLPFVSFVSLSELRNHDNSYFAFLNLSLDRSFRFLISWSVSLQDTLRPISSNKVKYLYIINTKHDFQFIYWQNECSQACFWLPRNPALCFQ